MKREIPDILVEQLLLDELDPATKEELLKDTEVLRRLERLSASNAEILETYPPAEMGSRIEGRLQADSVGSTDLQYGRDVSSHRGELRARNRGLIVLLRRRGLVPALAAAAVIALVVGIAPLLLHRGITPSDESGVRVKGSVPTLHVYRETRSGVELLGNGARASAHDLLQLSYIAAGARYGLIFSIDGSGTVTLHFPVASRLAAPLEGGGEIALPHSYELDNAPRFERFYLVTSSSQFSVDEILDKARKEAATGNYSIAFPRGFKVASLTVIKETEQ